MLIEQLYRVGRVSTRGALNRMPSHQHYLAPELANPLAAIDIGTNSIRLIIADGLRDGKYRILDDEKDATRLGARLESTGKLSPEAVERAIVILRRMKQIIEGYQCTRMRVIATCAVRDASDGPQFCQRVKDEVGLDIEVISAKQEGRLSFLSVQRNFDLAGVGVVTADIGGGSTEMVAAINGVVEDVYTTPLGAVRLTERFRADQKLSRPDFERMCNEIDKLIEQYVGRPRFTPQMLIGTGGTFTAVASMLMAMKGQTNLPMRGYTVMRAEVRHLVDRLSKLPVKARREEAGLSPERADIIVAGVAIIDRLLRHFDVNRLQIHTGGVRDGLLLTMVDSARGMTPESGETPDRAAAVRRFAAACNVDMKHGLHVSFLAGQIWSQLAPMFGLAPEDQSLLETAALLQDVGYLINYEDHHKHSYHLIMNSDLPGFTIAELNVVGNVARYHRGSEPKKKHAAFSHLSSRDQTRVKQMAAVLRLAGGLDRSHTQQVHGVQLQQDGHNIELLVDSERDPDLDVWGARRRAEMFESIFKASLSVHRKHAED